MQKNLIVRFPERDIMGIYLISGAHLKSKEEELSLIHEVVGKALTRVLEPGETVNIHQLIGALYRLSVRSENPDIRMACEKAIEQLAKKLN